MVIMPEEVTSINDLLFNHEPAYQMLKSIVIDDLEYTHASVDELRALVRATTKQYIHVIEQALSADPSKTFEQIKRPHIVSLKNIVDTKDNLNIW